MAEKPSIPLLRLDRSGMLSGEEYHDDENYDEKLRDVDLDQPRARRRGIVNCNSCLFLFLFILLLTLFFELTFWHMLFGPRTIHSINPDDSSTTITYPQEQLPEFARTNGTNVFSPTTILLVVSGLGSSMLHTNSTPNLMSIAEQGVAPLHLTPPFPALDAPCLWTLTTGLNPISHGVVSDNFFDSKLNATYNFTGLTAASKRYWSADNNTIWQVAKDQNISTVVLNWPSVTTPAAKDSCVIFNTTDARSAGSSFQEIIRLIDSDDDERPQLISSYVSELGKEALHPNASETTIRLALTRLDREISSFYQALYSRNLSDVVNVVVVSDHGHSWSSKKKALYLDDYIDLERISAIEGLPLMGLRPVSFDSLNTIYWDLWIRSMVLGSHFNVFTANKLPKSWNYWPSTRVAPLWLVPDAGYTFEESRNTMSKFGRPPSGRHIAYDPEDEDMTAAFVATGPAFRPLEGSKRGVGNVKSFSSTAVKRLICDSLSLDEESCPAGDSPPDWTLEFII